MKAESIEKRQSIYQDIRAFSFHWPFVVCTGFGNYLILVNAFDRKPNTLRRIQIAPVGEEVLVCQTFLTET